MKKTCFYCGSFFLLMTLFVGCRQAPSDHLPVEPVKPAALPLAANPIDAVFDKELSMEMATAELALVAETCLDAWQAELQSVSGRIRGLYGRPEDRQRLEDYLAGYEALGKAAFDLELLNWMDDDPQAAIEERSVGTGGPGAATLTLAKLTRQAVLNLIDHYNSASPETPYIFQYSGSGSVLEKHRQSRSEAP